MKINTYRFLKGYKAECGTRFVISRSRVDAIVRLYTMINY